MTTIERYDDKYKTDVEWLVQSFQEESLKDYGLELNLETLSKTIASVHDEIFLLIKDGKAVGILAGKPVDMPLTDELVWAEMVWFVLKGHREHGIQFLLEVRRALKAQGYVAMTLVCMENSMKDKLFRLYERLGFKPMEHHFIGRL